MNVVQLMVTIIIVTILVTVILGVVSYIAYWLRRSRRPVDVEEPVPALRFFYRYVPDYGELTGNGNGRVLPDVATNSKALTTGALASARTRTATIAS